MKTATIARNDLLFEPQPWPGASPDNVLSVIAARRGLRLRPNFNPTLNDLVPPWRIDENTPNHGDLTITQGVDVAKFTPTL